MAIYLVLSLVISSLFVNLVNRRLASGRTMMVGAHDGDVGPGAHRDVAIPPPPPPPPRRRPDLGDWVRRNLFRSPFDADRDRRLRCARRLHRLPSRCGSYSSPDGGRSCGSTSSCSWSGSFPTDDLCRIAVALIVLAGWGGVLAGLVAPTSAWPAGPVRRVWMARALDLLDRFWVPVVGHLLLLLLTTTAGPWLTAGGVLAAAVVGRFVGGIVGRVRLGAIGGLVPRPGAGRVPVVLVLLPRRRRSGSTTGSGFMLNLFLAVCAHRALLPARRAPGPRPSLEAAAHPGRLDRLHRDRSAAPRCSCCCCSPTSPSSSSFPRGSPRRRSSPGDRRVHPVHRGLHG